MQISRPFSSIPNNSAKYVSLIPVDSNDNRFLSELYKRRNIDFEGATYSITRPKGQSLSSIKKMIEKRELSDDFYYSINLTQEEAVDNESIIAGVIQGIWKDSFSGVIEIGINIFPDYRGMGIGGKSLDLLIDRLTNHFNVYKFVSHILSCNENSKNLFLSRGFERCGCHKNHWISGGIRHDVEIYELIVSK